MKSKKLMLILKYSVLLSPIYKPKSNFLGNYPIVFLKNISDPSQIGSEGRRRVKKINKSKFCLPFKSFTEFRD